MQQKAFVVTFAVGGDLTPVLDPVDPTGLVNFNTGWGADYQRNQLTDPLAKVIDRGSMNFMFNAVTGAVGALQARGVPEWMNATNNDGTSFPYQKNARVLYQDPVSNIWTQYDNTVDGNVATPGVDATWQPSLVFEATVTQASDATNSTTIITPRRLSTAVQTAFAQFGTDTSMVAFFAASTAPVGWLPANGAVVPRASYPQLFAMIGTTYGAGDGATTFQLPDMRGQFARGFDAGRGIDPGRVFGSLQTSMFASHVHGISDFGHVHGVAQSAHAHGTAENPHAHNTQIQAEAASAGNNKGYFGPSGGPPTQVDTWTSQGAVTGLAIEGATANISINAAATGVTVVAAGGTETRPTNLAFLACIKYLL